MKIISALGRKELTILSWFGYSFALLFFLLLSQPGYEVESRILAWLVFVVGTLPMARYLIIGSSGIPVIELILLAYVNAFSLPLFFQEKQRILAKTLYPDVEPVSTCLLLVLLAIPAMWFGYQASIYLLKNLSIPKLKLHCETRRLFYYGIFLCILSLALSSIKFFSYQGAMNIIASADLGVALLSFLYYKGDLSKKEKILVAVLVLLLVLNGVASGLTQAILQPVFIWYICRWLTTRKFEISIILIGVAIFVLLQPVKLEYRNNVWFGGFGNLTTVEKVEKFGEIFTNYWFFSEKEKKVVESTYSRTSLLLQTSHVIDWTPDIVPYKYGDTLYFMAVTWVPRFIWPNKPTAQQANIDYALDYGVSTKWGIERTMFGVGHLGDAYMNYGPIGIPIVFFVLGIICYMPVYLLSITKKTIYEFRTSESQIHLASMALLIAVMIKLIYIGSSISDAYGGIIQLLIVQGIMLTLVAGTRKRAS